MKRAILLTTLLLSATSAFAQLENAPDCYQGEPVPRPENVATISCFDSESTENATKSIRLSKNSDGPWSYTLTSIQGKDAKTLSFRMYSMDEKSAQVEGCSEDGKQVLKLDTNSKSFVIINRETRKEVSRIEKLTCNYGESLQLNGHLFNSVQTFAGRGSR